MQSNYKRLGDYIKEVKTKNTDLSAKSLLGINIDKFFMPSVANIIGTDMANYRIVKKGQFACNRMHVGRDYRIPIALSNKDEPFMVSPAYDVFEIIDTSVLVPEYLMMWFTRKEFDRNAWFYTDADVRGGLPWKSFCDMQLPIPHPDKQREIVKEYITILNRIELNEQLNQKLEETAQALYKQWFVDFEFPDENGKPYKSNGGAMGFNEEFQQEIPKGWQDSNISKIADVIDCLHTKKPESISDETGFILLQIENINDFGLLDLTSKYWISENDYKIWTSRIEITEGDCIITNVGKDAVARIPKGIKAALGRNMTGIRLKEHFQYHTFFIQLLTSSFMINEIESKKDTGTIMQALNVKSIPKLRFIEADKNTLFRFEKVISVIRQGMEFNFRKRNKLIELQTILLSNISTN